MDLPYIRPREYKIKSVTRFNGLNLTADAAEGDSGFEENLSSGDYPRLAVRGKRKLFQTTPAPVEGMTSNGGLAAVYGGRLYYNGLPTPVENLSEGEKQIVPFGAYICVFPDKVYYNTADDTDFGSMEAHFVSSLSVACEMCTLAGSNLTVQHTGATEPANPSHGDYWLNTSDYGYGLYVYDSPSGSFSAVAAAYTRITFPTKDVITKRFNEGDAVEICDAPTDSLNGLKALHRVFANEAGFDCIVIEGLCPGAISGSGIKIHRSVPDMDYVCACRNRLWGCFFGNDGNKNINEIYACALGDFKNWQSFFGISTDSFVSSVGSPGKFTGAADYMGSPCFFKEDRLHRVTVSAVGAHSVSDTPMSGVAPSCGKSLVVSGGSLYYKAREGFMVWQGGMPSLISGRLGSLNDSVCTSAGTAESLYYAAIKDKAGEKHLLCYDTERDVWHREDDLEVSNFAACQGKLYAAVNKDEAGRIILLNPDSEENLDEEIHWEYTTPVINCKSANNMYLSMVHIRLFAGEPVNLRIFAEYDGKGTFEEKGVKPNAGTGSIVYPIIPRRCDTLRLKLVGAGQASIAEISYKYEKGSRRTVG